MVKKAAQIFGIVLLLIGVLGFIPGISTDDMLLGVFHVNAAHNVVHLLTGAIALWAAMQADSKASRMYFQVFGIVYALVAILGFLAGDSDILGFISSNSADTWLHVVIALFALYLGFGTKAEA